jgi:hypothetical protein
MLVSGRGRPFAGVLVACAAGTGCAALFEGPGDYPPRDAGGEARADTGTAGDAGDAGSGSGVGVRCTAVDAFFCEDFDEGAPGWLSTPKGGTVGVVEGGATSPPNALRATVMTTDAAVMASYYRTFTSKVGLRAATLTFDVDLESQGPKNAAIGQISFRSAPSASPVYAVEVSAVATSFVLSENGPADGGAVPVDTMPCGPTAPSGTWARVSLALDFDARTLTFTAPGAPTCSKKLLYAAAVVPSLAPTIELGLPFVAAQGDATWAVREDSVVFDVR